MKCHYGKKVNPWPNYWQITCCMLIPILSRNVAQLNKSYPLHFIICWQLILQQITVLSCPWQVTTHHDSCRAAHYDGGELGLTAKEMENIALTDRWACSWAANISEQSNLTLRSDILSRTFSQHPSSVRSSWACFSFFFFFFKPTSLRQKPGFSFDSFFRTSLEFHQPSVWSLFSPGLLFVLSFSFGHLIHLQYRSTLLVTIVNFLNYWSVALCTYRCSNWIFEYLHSHQVNL